MKQVNYRETFIFPDIPGQLFPVYAIGKNERLVNFKSIIYPNPRSIKRFTRNKQLRNRSKQASMFDCLINIGYFGGLDIYREFPVIIQNSKRLPGQDKGLFYLCDYYFPSLKLAVELDSELHDKGKDEIRDRYLQETHGIKVFRMEDFHKPTTQRGKFKDLVKILKNTKPLDNPEPLCLTNDLYMWLENKDSLV